MRSASEVRGLGRYAVAEIARSELLRAAPDDTRKGIMQGRVPLHEWDEVKNRRKEAGDGIRAEFEQPWETRTS
ncbi:hypothetical protein OIE71_32040 [Streptomyces sp. NBC_01725]|uniref:hypothetical protein n=1 Tax=Streptomyces sp. NBC_01725 TaxID=2975923 RepID=UPI002E2E6D1B|nr:hypothetical protein [Streptomyces sp. NBC_01725]